MSKATAQPEQCAVSAGSDRIGVWLRERAQTFGNRVALVGATSSGAVDEISFVDLERRSAHYCRGLQRLGLRRGDGIAVWLPNRPSWMMLHFAAARLGLLTVPINTWSRDSEVSHLLGLGRCRAIVVDSTFRSIGFDDILVAALREMKAKEAPLLEWVIDASSSGASVSFGDTIQRISLSDIEVSDGPQSDCLFERNSAAIAFSTSGTSSVPKLAVHSEAVLVAHADAVAGRALMTERDIVLGVLPPCGAYGHGLLLAALSAGARSIMMEEFDLDAIMDRVIAERVTMMALTEPLMRKLFAHSKASRAAFRSLRIVFSAGATLQAVVTRAEEEFGVRVSNVYGSSEILALAAFWEFDRVAVERSAAGGRLTGEGMRVRAVDAEGAVLPPGAEGELQFAGPIVTSGYLGNAEASRNALSSDGWFKSQDLGCVIDDAQHTFHYIARLTDAIRVKGFLVSPGEIEAMLQSHPRVAAAQVVGIPDGHGEELAAAFVVLHPGPPIDAAELRGFSGGRMASYKVPAILEIVEDFPVTRSANGDKVIKHRLRDMAQRITRS